MKINPTHLYNSLSPISILPQSVRSGLYLKILYFVSFIALNYYFSYVLNFGGHPLKFFTRGQCFTHLTIASVLPTHINLILTRKSCEVAPPLLSFINEQTQKVSYFVQDCGARVAKSDSKPSQLCSSEPTLLKTNTTSQGFASTKAFGIKSYSPRILGKK